MGTKKEEKDSGWQDATTQVEEMPGPSGMLVGLRQSFDKVRSQAGLLAKQEVELGKHIHWLEQLQKEIEQATAGFTQSSANNEKTKKEFSEFHDANKKINDALITIDQKREVEATISKFDQEFGTRRAREQTLSKAVTDATNSYQTAKVDLEEKSKKWDVAKSASQLTAEKLKGLQTLKQLCEKEGKSNLCIASFGLQQMRSAIDQLQTKTENEFRKELNVSAALLDSSTEALNKATQELERVKAELASVKDTVKNLGDTRQDKIIQQLRNIPVGGDKPAQQMIEVS